LLAGRAQLLVQQAAFPGRPRGDRWAPRPLYPQGLVKALGEPFERDLTVAGLRALVADYDPDHCAHSFQEQGSLPRLQGRGTGYVEDQFHSGVGGIGVLASRATAGTEAPFQVSRRDNQPPPPNSKAFLEVRQQGRSFRPFEAATSNIAGHNGGTMRAGQR
jgi:hypothetical protein